MPRAFINAEYIKHRREVEQKLQELEVLPTFIRTQIQNNYPNITIKTTFEYEVVSEGEDPDYDEIPF